MTSFRTRMIRAETAKRPNCPACGWPVSLASLGSGKARVRHKCPHRRLCVSSGALANQGWNPRGPAHKLKCEDCWKFYCEGRKT